MLINSISYAFLYLAVLLILKAIGAGGLRAELDITHSFFYLEYPKLIFIALKNDFFHFNQFSKLIDS